MPGGDASSKKHSKRINKVSIHASRCREAMHGLRRREFAHAWFQSTPRQTLAAERIRKFQSTPPVAGRRCESVSIETLEAGRFQSTPPVAGRRCSGSDEVLKPLHVVSIHASRCREAMRCCEPADQRGWRFNPRLPLPGGDAQHMQMRSRRSGRFNPRLPLPGGDAVDMRIGQVAHVVSIHASRCREAMLAIGRNVRPLRFVSIHASRCREAMRAGLWQDI